MADTDDLLTPADVAAHLVVSVRSVRRYADSGHLAPVRLGRTVRYRRVDVGRLLAERQGGNGQDTGQNGHNGQGIPDMAAVAAVAPPVAGVVSADGPAAAAPLAAVPAQAVTALQEELAALRGENGALRAEPTAKAEAAGMWQGRARTPEEQLRQLTAGRAEATAPQNVPIGGPGAPEAPPATATTPAAHRPLQGRWQRLRRRLAGGWGGTPRGGDRVAVFPDENQE